MGAWDVDTFDNDTANDWAFGLEDVTDLSLVQQALDACILEDDYLDADVGCETLAACEVIARLKGRPGKQDAYTEKVDQWVAKHPQLTPADLCTLAAEKIDLIMDESKSELAELWEGDEQWIRAVTSLRERVVT